MSRVKGPPTQKLRNFSKKLRAVPRVAAIDVARRAAPAISRLAPRSFNAGLDVYDAPRRLGRRGNALSLVRTGDARGSLQFASDGGARIRAVLSRPYVRYLIRKYKILPIGNAAMPVRWQLTINTIFAEVLGRALGIEPTALRRVA